jgi:UDP-glucose 4-epimerase
MAEQILKDYAKERSSLKAIMLRYFNPVGAHSSGLIGEIPNGFPNNLFPYLLEVGSGKRKELSIFGNDYTTTDGTCIRDFIHVSDLATGHLASLNYILNYDNMSDNTYNKNYGFYEVFNLGTGCGVSVLEFVETFISVTGVEIPYKFVEKRPGDVMSSYANADKACKFLGWKAEKTLSDICIDGWNFSKSL